MGKLIKRESFDADKFFKEQEEMANEQEKNEEYVSSDEYIKWLDKFTMKVPAFSTAHYPYTTDEIAKDDLENINRIQYLYSVIDDYASTNYIYPDKDNGAYFIEYNDFKFAIGTAQYQYFLVSRTLLCNNTEYIDFKNIINNIDLKSTKIIDKELDDLSKKIVKLTESVPAEAIKQMIKDASYKIDESNNDVKVLTLKQNRRS